MLCLLEVLRKALRIDILFFSLLFGYSISEECFQENIKFKGILITKQKIKIPSPEKCLSLCRASTQCHGIVYENQREKCRMYTKINKIKKTSNTVAAFLEDCKKNDNMVSSTLTGKPGKIAFNCSFHIYFYMQPGDCLSHS